MLILLFFMAGATIYSDYQQFTLTIAAAKQIQYIAHITLIFVEASRHKIRIGYRKINGTLESKVSR